mmetsp:Transcript_3926/g.2649  ORF Transcript_3926/g.2649 Transcript_3926/m.2649 type:complete len:108 (-) Transcript_3926:430-753(-)
MGELNTSYDVEIYDIDLFDVSAEQMADLKADDHHVICYFSAGTIEDWRVDAKHFDQDTICKAMGDWDGEWWLDVTKIDKLMPIMEKRMDLAVEKGCEGVEPDNVDGW